MLSHCIQICVVFVQLALVWSESWDNEKQSQPVSRHSATTEIRTFETSHAPRPVLPSIWFPTSLRRRKMKIAFQSDTISVILAAAISSPGVLLCETGAPLDRWGLVRVPNPLASCYWRHSWQLGNLTRWGGTQKSSRPELLAEGPKVSLGF